MILVTNNKVHKLKLIAFCFFLMLGLFVFVEVLNDIMFEQFDDRIIDLQEH